MEQIEAEEERERDEDQERGPFITDWSLLGPFSTQEKHDLDQDFLLEHGGETNILPRQEQKFRNSKNQTLKWRPTSGKREAINLVKEIGGLDDVTAYAFCQIESPTEEYVAFGLGSDDAVKVWINGLMVHQSQESRGVIIDQDQFIVKLNSGSNTCLIKVSQGMGDWGFVIRSVDRFPLNEGVMLSGRLILEGKNKDSFPLIRLQASIDSSGTQFSQDWGTLAHGDKYQRVIRTTKGSRLKLQAVARGIVLAEQDIELRSGQEKGVDLIVDTGSSLALKVLNLGAVQSAYEFVRTLKERRQFIRQRRGEIMAEIADGTPQWETRPQEPWVLKLIFGTPFPMNNWKHDEVFGRNFPIGGWGELVNLSRLIFSGSILLLCCFQLFGRRYSIHWYWQVLKKYVAFSGRARRNEYWMFHCCNALVFVIIPMISSATLAFIMGGDVELVLIVWGLSIGLYGLGTLIPSLAVSIRRLHDIGRSGWLDYSLDLVSV